MRVKFSADVGMLPSLPWKVDKFGDLRAYDGKLLGRIVNEEVAEFVEELSRQALEGERAR